MPLKNKSNILLISIIALSLLLTLAVLWPYLWDRYEVVRDLQNFYWMALYQDASLFPVDYLMKDQMLHLTVWGWPVVLHPVSLGHSLIFYLVSPLLDQIWFSKWLVVMLMPLCVIYLFKIGQNLENNGAAVSLSSLFVFMMLASYQSISLASGLQRAFAIPLLIMFFYYMLKEQYYWTAWCIVLSALFFWPNVPLMLVTYGLSLLTFQKPFRVSLPINWAKLMPLLVSFLLSLLILVPELLLQFDVLKPKNIPTTENPAFQTEGATPLFINPPWLGRAGIFDAGIDLVNFVLMVMVAIVIYQVVGPRSFQRLPRLYWRLLAAALIMYAASFVVLVGLSSSILYQPSRYTRSTLFLLAILYIGLNWNDFLKQAPSWFRRKAPLLMVIGLAIALAIGVALVLPLQAILMPVLWLVGVLLCGLVVIFASAGLYWLVKSKSNVWGRIILSLLLSLAVLAAGIYYVKTLGLRTIGVSPAERDVYEFVSTLPKDAILAGDPVVMAGIPLFSRRSVLFRDLHPNVNPNVTPLIFDYFDAQYAETSEPVLNFCRRYQVDYLVLDKTEFSPEYLAEGKFFYAPWNDKIVEMVAGRTDFVLPHSPPIFQSDPYLVIKCDAASR